MATPIKNRSAQPLQSALSPDAVRSRAERERITYTCAPSRICNAASTTPLVINEDYRGRTGTPRFTTLNSRNEH